MVSKEEQQPIKACYNFFHLDRVIAWLDEVAKVAHNNTSRRLGKKKKHRIITSELNLEWEHSFQAFLTWFRRKNDLGEVEKRTKEKTVQTSYIKTMRELFGFQNGSENKACFWIISPLKASKWSQITFCILSNVLSCISDRFCLNFEQINIPPQPAPSSGCY